MCYVPQAHCQEVRKRKELELQILTEPIRSWEGDDIKSLGSVTYMSQVTIQCAGSEVLGPTFTIMALSTRQVLYLRSRVMACTTDSV